MRVADHIDMIVFADRGCKSCVSHGRYRMDCFIQSLEIPFFACD